jgi:hypothetical protein
MKHLLIGLFALATVLGTGCTKDEAVKPLAKPKTLMTKEDPKGKPVGGDIGDCNPCVQLPPK